MSPARFSLTEWASLAVLDEGPNHRFALAALLEPEGQLGRIWQVPRSAVYRAVDRLEDVAFIECLREEPGNGPARQIYTSTTSGSRAIRRWLGEPVARVREVRPLLLMKLALLDRRGWSTVELLERQQLTLAETLAALDTQEPADDVDQILTAWRREGIGAVISFLETLQRTSTQTR